MPPKAKAPSCSACSDLKRIKKPRSIGETMPCPACTTPTEVTRNAGQILEKMLRQRGC